jgi:hypothetical protein
MYGLFHSTLPLSSFAISVREFTRAPPGNQPFSLF